MGIQVSVPKPDWAPADWQDPVDEEGLTDLQKLFVARFCQHFNASRAAKEAGYEGVWAKHYGSELLTKPPVQRAIARVRAALGEAHFVLADQVVGLYTAMARADPTEIYDAEGNLLDPRDWPEDCKLLLEGIEIEERMTGEGDAAEMIRTKKVKLTSRKGVLDSLSRVLGQWVQPHQFLGKDGKPVDPPTAVTVRILAEGQLPPPPNGG